MTTSWARLPVAAALGATALLGSRAAAAGDAGPAADEALTLSLSRGYALAAQPTPAAADADSAPRPGDAAPAADNFGHAGSTWLSFKVALANNFGPDSDVNASVAWSIFLADELEFGVEAAA